MIPGEEGEVLALQDKPKTVIDELKELWGYLVAVAVIIAGYLMMYFDRRLP